MKQSGIIQNMKGSMIQRHKVQKKEKVDTSSKISADLNQQYESQKHLSQSYKEKNQKNLIKCKFLYDKIQKIGSIDGVPQEIIAQGSQIQKRINQLQKLIYFKRSKQFKKLKLKVFYFFERIGVDIARQDIEMIEDEIQIILLLIDIFQQKFIEMTQERDSVDQIIQKLLTDDKSGETVSKDMYEQLKNENDSIKQKITSLQTQIKHILQLKPQIQQNHSENGNFSHFNLKNLNQLSILKDRVIQLENEIELKNFQIKKLNKKLHEAQNERKQFIQRIQILEHDFNRSKKQQQKWKQRYKVMESQKDERIQLIEASISKVSNKNGL